VIGCERRGEGVYPVVDAAMFEIGKCANGIAPPAHSINRQPVDFEYVKFH
jgi:hypothetical protein